MIDGNRASWRASCFWVGTELAMTYLDLALLNLTEWACRRFQVWTGRTNVWLAIQLTNLSIVVYFAGLGVYFVTVRVVPRVALALFCAALMYVLTQTVFRVPIEAYESSAYRRVAKGLRNPRRVRDVPLRLSFLTLSLVLIYPLVYVYTSLHVRLPPVLLLSHSLIVLTTVILYLLACDPLPPGPGRLPAWLARPAASRLTAGEARGAEPVPLEQHHQRAATWPASSRR